MAATTFAELFGAVFPTEAQVETLIVYGPTGAEYTGTVVGGGGAPIVVTTETTITRSEG